MAIKSIIDCERKSIANRKNFQLPNRFKKIGIGLAILSFLALIINKFSADSETIRIAARYGLLIGILLVSISREKIEDELISKLRMQSYTFAFVIGVIFAMAQPFLNYGVDLLVEGDQAFFKETGDFEILWILLSVQVLYFEMLKRLA